MYLSFYLKCEQQKIFHSCIEIELMDSFVGIIFLTRNSILLHSSLNSAWQFWLLARFPVVSFSHSFPNIVLNSKTCRNNCSELRIDKFIKGQKISKSKYGFLISSKKRMKLTILIKEYPQDSVFCSFLGELRTQ